MSALHIVCPHCHSTNRVPQEKLNRTPVCGKCKKVLFTGQAVDVSHKAFNQQIARSDIPVVVDFWAAWCGPCKMMAPVFQKAAAELEPAYRLVKLDTEKIQPVAVQFGIRSIPTVVIFKHGKELARQAGAMSLPQLKSWIVQYS